MLLLNQGRLCVASKRNGDLGVVKKCMTTKQYAKCNEKANDIIDQEVCVG